VNPALKVAGIVFTMFDSQARLSLEVVGEMEQFFEQARGKGLPWSDTVLFKTRIRRNIKLAESPSFGQTILQYDTTSNGAADYRALAREVLNLGKAGRAAAAAVPAPALAPLPATSSMAEPALAPAAPASPQAPAPASGDATSGEKA
jgi:chromosome partitioning protein